MDKGRKLAFFIPSLQGGGAERVMVSLANRLAEKGYNVHLVVARAHGPYVSDVQPCVRVVDLGAGRVVASLWPLVKYLRRERPFALLSTLDHANAIAIMARFVARTSTRSVIRLANVYRPTTEQSLIQRIVVSLIRMCYRWADHVIAVSRGVAESITKIVPIRPEQLTIINNPVDMEHIGLRAREPVTSSWFAPGELPVILGVGRLTEQKDFGTLIRAFARVRLEQEVLLVILGEGEKRPELESLVARLGLEDCVLLPGFVNNPYAYMYRSAVFVLSSRWEGFPNVLLEAIALGTPVVATDCIAGPTDILEDGRRGPLVPVGDDEAMAQAILQELERGPGPRVELQDRAEDFSPEVVTEQYLALLTAGRL